MNKEQIEPTFETPVTLKMILLYIYAWITRKKVIHTGIKVKPQPSTK